jgi:hypothetical protein
MLVTLEMVEIRNVGSNVAIPRRERDEMSGCRESCGGSKTKGGRVRGGVLGVLLWLEQKRQTRCCHSQKSRHQARG